MYTINAAKTITKISTRPPPIFMLMPNRSLFACFFKFVLSLPLSIVLIAFALSKNVFFLSDSSSIVSSCTSLCIALSSGNSSSAAYLSSNARLASSSDPNMLSVVSSNTAASASYCISSAFSCVISVSSAFDCCSGVSISVSSCEIISSDTTSAICSDFFDLFK